MSTKLNRWCESAIAIGLRCCDKRRKHENKARQCQRKSHTRRVVELPYTHMKPYIKVLTKSEFSNKFVGNSFPKDDECQKMRIKPTCTLKEASMFALWCWGKCVNMNVKVNQCERLSRSRTRRVVELPCTHIKALLKRFFPTEWWATASQKTMSAKRWQKKPTCALGTHWKLCCLENVHAQQVAESHIYWCPDCACTRNTGWYTRKWKPPQWER